MARRPPRPENSRKRAQVTSQTLVQIRIRGYDQSQPGDHLPRVLDDEGLVAEFLKWQCQQDFYAVHTPYSGAGGLMAYYEPDDAEKVLAWLKEHNKR